MLRRETKICCEGLGRKAWGRTTWKDLILETSNQWSIVLYKVGGKCLQPKSEMKEEGAVNGKETELFEKTQSLEAESRGHQCDWREI